MQKQRPTDNAHISVRRSVHNGQRVETAQGPSMVNGYTECELCTRWGVTSLKRSEILMHRATWMTAENARHRRINIYDSTCMRPPEETGSQDRKANQELTAERNGANPYRKGLLCGIRKTFWK